MTGLFGGRFDPPHLGHLALLRGAEGHFPFQRLVVLVLAQPGHKQAVTSAATRLLLARAAFAGYEVELDHHPRTVDLLRERRFPDPLLLVGADELASFLTWKEPEEVLELARLAVAARPGYPRERLDEVVRRLRRPDRVVLFDIEAVDVSSTEVRRRVAAGLPIDGLVPPAVARLIAELGLYRAGGEAS